MATFLKIKQTFFGDGSKSKKKYQNFVEALSRSGTLKVKIKEETLNRFGYKKMLTDFKEHHCIIIPHNIIAEAKNINGKNTDFRKKFSHSSKQSVV